MEGVDGAGKTTLARKLADHYHCDILSMTELGSKTFEDYVAKAKLNNIISDRSFLSEMVYSQVFHKQSSLTITTGETLLRFYREKGWKFIILTAPVETLYERLRIRGDEAPEKIEKLKFLNYVYKVMSVFYNIPMVNVETDGIEKIFTILEESDG